MTRICMMILALIWPMVLCATDAGVLFSHQGGFYDKPFPITLTCPKGYAIYYTINGNTPTISDLRYERPLLLDQALYSHSDIYTIQCCPDENWRVPKSIRHCIVVRAAAFNDDGERMGEVETNTYFIKSLGNDFHDLPVISLCVDSLSLFDCDTGIYVYGENGANYHQHGREWERLCNMEFYENDLKGINQQVGLRLHGNWTRRGMQKGMKFYARKEYGRSRLHYPFFGKEGNSSFKHLVLRPFASELYGDHLCTKIGENLNFEIPASRPVVVFLNGEYWGLYFLKERPDDQYIADHFGYNKEDVNIIESWSGVAAKGNNEGFLRMMRWVMQADMTNDSVYQLACQIIDMDCFIDYYCFQLFVANTDWPDNNMRCWQAQDGKWRWIFFDGGSCFNSFPQMLYFTIFSEENQDVSTYLFTKLLTNACFREQFYQRYGTLLTNEFYTKKTHRLSDLFFNSIEDEIAAHYHRFGPVDYGDQFDFQVALLDDFLKIRIVGAAAMIYNLYYFNNWEYKGSKSGKHVRFYKSGGKRPVFLFRMAKQFKDWRYVSAYFSYERFRIRRDFKESSFHRNLKSVKTWKIWKKQTFKNEDLKQN